MKRAATLIDDELNNHLAELVAEGVADGLSVEAAQAEAERRFGDVAATRQAVLKLHPLKRWPLLNIGISLYGIYGACLYMVNVLVPPIGLFGIVSEQLIVAWWFWLVIGLVMIFTWWLIEFYGLEQKRVLVYVAFFTLLTSLAITAVLDIDNFEVNVHAVAGTILFVMMMLAMWTHLAPRWRRRSMLGYVLLITLLTLREQPLFEWLWPVRCLYVTPDTVPLTGILTTCERIVWSNILLWPLYGVLVTGIVLMVKHFIRLWKNRATNWTRKIVSTAVVALLPILSLTVNTMNSRGELDVIPWKQSIYSAYWDILGRAPEEKDFTFYAQTRAYLQLSRIREVLYASDERKLKINLVFQEILQRDATVEEIERYADSYLRIEEIRKELQIISKQTLTTQPTSIQ